MFNLTFALCDFLHKRCLCAYGSQGGNTRLCHRIFPILGIFFWVRYESKKTPIAQSMSEVKLFNMPIIKSTIAIYQEYYTYPKKIALNWF
jgi:hypothetical protein